jgi:quercetin dioxygenase-like cupin family protein
VTARALERFPLHLGRQGLTEPQPEFPPDERAMQWYMDYGARHAADGAEGRLVSMFTFSENWTSWEMHPAGPEVVLCTSGSMTLRQEWADGRRETVTLGPGDYAINPSGVWHTADVVGETTGVFITIGEGTQHRPR